jgi:hypothetical protein
MSIKSWAKSSDSSVISRVYDLARTIYVRSLSMRAAIARRKYQRAVLKEYEQAVDQAIRYLKGGSVDGDIAEFGCHGTTAAVECRQLAAFGQRRNLHLFDSFRGPPEYTPEDRTAPEIIIGSWNDQGVPAKVSADALRSMLERLYKLGRINIYEGYFSDTLKLIPPQTRFGMVVMDCVVFSSTYEVLDYLFGNGLISEGGIFLVSSWNVSRASFKHSTRKAWLKAIEKHHVEYSDEGRYNWGGAKFIIHSYSATSAP